MILGRQPQVSIVRHLQRQCHGDIMGILARSQRTINRNCRQRRSFLRPRFHGRHCGRGYAHTFWSRSMQVIVMQKYDYPSLASIYFHHYLDRTTRHTTNKKQLGIKRTFAVYHVFWTLLVERLIIMFHIDHSSLLWIITTLPSLKGTLSSHWGDSFSNEEVLFRNLKQLGRSSPVILLLSATNMGHHCWFHLILPWLRSSNLGCSLDCCVKNANTRFNHET